MSGNRKLTPGFIAWGMRPGGTSILVECTAELRTGRSRAYHISRARASRVIWDDFFCLYKTSAPIRDGVNLTFASPHDFSSFRSARPGGPGSSGAGYLFAGKPFDVPISSLARLCPEKERDSRRRSRGQKRAQKADSFVSLVSTLRERDIESLSITEGEAPEFLFQSPPVEKESLDLAAQESRDFLSF